MSLPKYLRSKLVQFIYKTKQYLHVSEFNHLGHKREYFRINYNKEFQIFSSNQAEDEYHLNCIVKKYC